MAEVTSYTQGMPAWVELTTGDLDAARRFYGELLGWEFTSDDGEYYICTVRGHQVAGMYGGVGEGGDPPAWTTSMATSDVDATAKRVTDHGGQVLAGPDDAAQWGRYVVATDPAGAPFGAWQAGAMIGSELVNEPGTANWNELSTPNLAAARDFYTGVFGYTWEDVDTGAGGPVYATFSTEGQLAGGAMQSEPGGEPAWRIYFAVPDADAAVATVRRLGGTVVTPPMDSPYGRNAIVKDPQGATFVVISGGGAG